MSLVAVITALHTLYGPPAKPTVTDPWQMILHENAAYLVDDETRDETWQSLRRAIGTTSDELLKASPTTLASAIKTGGMNPTMRTDKLRRCAAILRDSFDGDPTRLLAGEPKAVRSQLKMFPGIGDPGTDKILLFSRTHPVLALDSNGLRVLLRLGFGKDGANYAASYRSAQHAITHEIQADFDWLIAAHQLLRQHGQVACKRTSPACVRCPLRLHCPVGRGERPPV